MNEMNAQRFCESCGAELTPGTRFCESCGAAVGSEAQPQAVTPPPMPSAPLSMPAPVTAVPGAQKSAWPIVGVLMLLIVAIVGVVAWKTLGGRPGIESKIASSTATAKADEPQALTLAGFEGKWVILTDDMDPAATSTIEFSEEGGKLVGTVDGEQGRMEMTDLKGRKVEGKYIDGDRSIPAWIELNEDGNQLTITLAPPNSEYETAIAWKEGYKPSMESRPPSGELTREDAISKVTSIPDVKRWIDNVANNAPRNSTVVDVDHEEGGKFIVHAYENVNNEGEPGHTATLGWYSVDKKTGEVNSVMP